MDFLPDDLFSVSGFTIGAETIEETITQAVRDAKDIVDAALGIHGDSIVRAQATVFVIMVLLQSRVAKERHVTGTPSTLSRFSYPSADAVCQYFIYPEYNIMDCTWSGSCDVTGGGCSGDMACGWRGCIHNKMKQHMAKLPQLPAALE